PPVILADEPTGNLDSGSSREIMKILHELHESGRTVILITHDDNIAANAKRVVRIMDGKIESDTVRDAEEESEKFVRDIDESKEDM
ncbi:MAG: macrolide ABC transporter ATP-binding protein, partial [Lachnospiraceae bacterium]|nr:macrolide ABC transporter ATP-binding protein [Lachnospiraceae bacterium]